MEPIKIHRFYTFDVYRFTSGVDMIFGRSGMYETSICGAAPFAHGDKTFKASDPDILTTPIEIGLAIHLAMFGFATDVHSGVSFGKIMTGFSKKESANLMAMVPARLMRKESARIQVNEGYTAYVTYDNVEKFYPDLPKSVIAHLNNYQIKTTLVGNGELELLLYRNYSDMPHNQLSDAICTLILNNFTENGVCAASTVLDDQPNPQPSPKKSERPSWDEYFMQNAELVAVRASCDRLSVGCILVQDNRVIANGYNGSISGHEHCDEIGHLMHDGSCKRTIHAEMNAILQCANNGVSTKGATAYVTHYPCPDCMKHLAQAGIARVVYGESYQHKYTNNFAKNMVVEQFVPSI